MILHVNVHFAMGSHLCESVWPQCAFVRVFLDVWVHLFVTICVILLVKVPATKLVVDWPDTPADG